MTFAYPADSGQDYEIIAHSGGMRARVIDDGAGGWRLGDNAAYIPRTQSTIDALYSDTR